MTLDRSQGAADTLSGVTASNRELILRVQQQLRDNEASLRAAREQMRRRRPEVERSNRVAATALRQLRAAGVLR